MKLVSFVQVSNGNVSSSWLQNGSCLDQISSHNFLYLSSESSNEDGTQVSSSDKKKQVLHNVISSSNERSVYKGRKSQKHIKTKEKERKKKVWNGGEDALQAGSGEYIFSR
ncbi:uncharacterized protein LOC144477796 isoform X2 [Augochlora pura]